MEEWASPPVLTSDTKQAGDAPVHGEFCFFSDLVLSLCLGVSVVNEFLGGMLKTLTLEARSCCLLPFFL